MTKTRVWRRRREIRLELLATVGRCFYCGWDLQSHPWAATLDHVDPQSAGGGEDRENLRLCCWRCNHTKGCRPIQSIWLHVRSRCMMRRDEQAHVLRRLIQRGENVVVGDGEFPFDFPES